jgi:hypothetical protein
MLKYVPFVGATALLACASPASAAVYLVNVSGTGGTASFNLDTSVGVVHSVGLYNAIDFYVPGVGIPGTLNGVVGGIRVVFFQASDLGGFEITGVTPQLNPPTPPIGAEGDTSIQSQIFLGTLANWSFAPGTFTFTKDASGNPTNETMIISDQSVSAVPEPASWAMMLVGFLGMGIALRRRSRTSALAA